MNKPSMSKHRRLARLSETFKNARQMSEHTQIGPDLQTGKSSTTSMEYTSLE